MLSIAVKAHGFCSHCAHFKIAIYSDSTGRFFLYLDIGRSLPLSYRGPDLDHGRSGPRYGTHAHWHLLFSLASCLTLQLLSSLDFDHLYWPELSATTSLK